MSDSLDEPFKTPEIEDASAHIFDQTEITASDASEYGSSLSTAE